MSESPAMFCYGPCFACGRLFTFNPWHVPSYEGEPICETCIGIANEVRKREGRELWPVDPRAYEPTTEL